MTKNSRLTVDVPKETLNYWKMHAIANNCSLREFLIQCMPQPNKLISRSELIEKSFNEVLEEFNEVFINLKDR